MTFVGAGILIYATKPDGHIVFLLGKENKGTDDARNGLYSDFGGHREKNEKPIDTAYREFKEETMNAIGKGELIKKMLKKPTMLYIGDNNYHEYIIKLEYNDDLPGIYNRIMKELEKCMTYKNIGTINIYLYRHVLLVCVKKVNSNGSNHRKSLKISIK